MLQIVASLIDAARGVIYDHHMFIVQATGLIFVGKARNLSKVGVSEKLYTWVGSSLNHKD
jgi:hypothetical protein